MKTAHFLRPDKTTSQNLASAVLDYTTDYGRKTRIHEILIHFTQAVSETITITRTLAVGATYNTVEKEVTLVAETDFTYKPSGEGLDLQAGDEMQVECTNANKVGTAKVTVKASEL